MKKTTLFFTAAVIMMSAAGVSASGYSDIESNDTELVEAVQDLESMNIITGYEDGTFKPENPITRAEVAVMTFRVRRGTGYEKLEAKYFPYYSIDASYSDLSENHWAFYELAIQANKMLVDGGVLNGYPDGTLRPDSDVTYTEAAGIILKELRYNVLIKESGEYPDGVMYWANDLGIIEGMDFTGGDDKKATRGDVAVMLHRALDCPYAKMFSEFLEEPNEIESGEGAFGTVGNVRFRWEKGTLTPRQDREKRGPLKDYVLDQETIDRYNAEYNADNER